MVDDQIGSPTYTGHLAEALAALVDSGDHGVHHMAASGSCSWFEFAREIFERAGREVRAEPVHQRRVPAPGAAPRVVGARQRARASPAAWREGLQAYLAGARG